jgi:hypothetical protein
MAPEIFKRGFLILSNKDLSRETTCAQIEILNELNLKSISVKKKKKKKKNPLKAWLNLIKRFNF